MRSKWLFASSGLCHAWTVTRVTLSVTSGFSIFQAFIVFQVRITCKLRLTDGDGYIYVNKKDFVEFELTLPSYYHG